MPRRSFRGFCVDCEVLLQPGTSLRGEKMLRAMVQAAAASGITTLVTPKWRGASPLLMTYGLGHVGRRPWLEQHKANGGRLIGWDLGYWNRDTPVSFSMRLTLDDDHPHRWIRPEPPERFASAGIELREDFDPAGPVVLCGLGWKQRRWKGLRGQEWEESALRRIRRRYPGRKVIYRPKKLEAPLWGTTLANGSIEDSLRGASLLVCAHSNVAVDACIAGVPVECDDGAALALYRGNQMPTRDQRLAFLQSLAWWQWTPLEAVQAWDFIKERLA